MHKYVILSRHDTRVHVHCPVSILVTKNWMFETKLDKDLHWRVQLGYTVVIRNKLKYVFHGPLDLLLILHSMVTVLVFEIELLFP